MVATILNSIVIIILSVTLILQMKEIVSLRKRCKELEFNHVLLDDSLSRLEVVFDESERMSEAVPKTE